MSDKVWPAYLRSEFDVAVLQAFKAVEVSVREAAKLSNDLIGEKLTRKAFDPKDGQLTDMQADEGEKEARSHSSQVRLVHTKIRTRIETLR